MKREAEVRLEGASHVWAGSARDARRRSHCAPAVAAAEGEGRAPRSGCRGCSVPLHHCGAGAEAVAKAAPRQRPLVAKAAPRQHPLAEAYLTDAALLACLAVLASVRRPCLGRPGQPGGAALRWASRRSLALRPAEEQGPMPCTAHGGQRLPLDLKGR